MKIDKTVPSEKSVNTLLAGLNRAVARFEKDNPKVSKGMLMPVVFQLMLGFPYGWLASSGHREMFIEAVSSEAKAYFVMMEAQAKAAQEAVISQVVEDGASPVIVDDGGTD